MLQKNITTFLPTSYHSHLLGLSILEINELDINHRSWLLCQELSQARKPVAPVSCQGYRITLKCILIRATSKDTDNEVGRLMSTLEVDLREGKLSANGGKTASG